MADDDWNAHKVSEKIEEVEEVETKELFQQFDVFKPLSKILKRSKFGRMLILTVKIVLLSIFILVSYLGGIIAGIVAMATLLLIAVFVAVKYVRIETINPASRGIPKILGKRIAGYTLDEGATVVIDHVPFIGEILGYVPIHIGTVDIDFKEVKIYDKGNFDLIVDGAFSIEADPNKLMEFYTRGGANGIYKEDETTNGRRHKKGETVKEEEGTHGIVDLLLGMIQSALLKEAGKLEYDAIIKSRATLENEALKKITMNPDADVKAMNPNEPYYITGMGANILTFIVSRIEPGEELKKIVTQKAKENAERVFRGIDAETAKLLYQKATGITDEELERVDKKVLESFYLKVKMVEKADGESGIDFGKNLLEISAAGLLDRINLEDINGILNLFSKFKGGK